MDSRLTKEKFISCIVDTAISAFATSFSDKHLKGVNNPNGVINSKRNNCFIAELGEDFIIFSALSRSFDSAFGKVLELIGKQIACISYSVFDNVDSFYLPEQDAYIKSIITNYDKRDEYPKIKHYQDFCPILPKNTSSFKFLHPVDNLLYDREADCYYIIELKAGGDLDNKKSKIEKQELLKTFFMLKNKIASEGKKSDVKIFFATAYNKYGEGNEWKQERVLQYFAKDELLIGRDYWNFVCKDSEGFNTVISQFRKSASQIREALSRIKGAYRAED